ncbi:MAG TPA: FAD-binding and (Fe-S)-binding domain-containing protein, partial [Candidatus Limnocylindrales bacterium]
GPSAEPVARLRHQEVPRGDRAPFPSEAARALADDLSRRIEGEVRFDAGSRALYATDGSNYRQVPIGVVRPRDRDDLEAVVAVCHEHDAPVTLRGGGTSLAGQACNVAVVVDCSRHLTRILELDPGARTARVEPGVVLDDLRAAAAPHGLTFAPDPATHDRCTLGGMLGNDSCGVHSLLSGRTSDNVESLEVLTYDGLRLRVGRTDEEAVARFVAEGGRRGELYGRLRDIRDRWGDEVRDRFPRIPRLVSGYALDRLLPERGFDVAAALVGTEGTCATVLSATVRLVPNPAGRALLLLGFPDVLAAADAVPAVLESGPIGLEGVSGPMFDALRAKRLHLPDLELFPDGAGWLLAEYGADDDVAAEAGARRAAERLAALHPNGSRVLAGRAEQTRAWRVRESALGATAQAPGQPPTWPGWEDSAVPPEHLGDYLRELVRLLDRFGYRHALYGHFGQGCVHLRIDFDFRSTPGTAAFRRFVTEAADLVVGFGGSLSGEHGDGQARAELLPRMFGPSLVEAFGAFKAAWDPAGRMNPGKVVEPRPLDADLRLAGPAGWPPAPPTTFRFPDDEGSLTSATLRCVGVGACRREDGGVMCPSYQATREERHSTRGRAHLLYEMLRGEVLEDGWRSRAVKDALDLCLACKGCKGDCPVRVDVATYKAEFLSHFYAGRPRPRSGYAMGLIHWWARLAAHAPAAANAAGRAPVLGRLARLLAGVDERRTLPAFADRTFRDALADEADLATALSADAVASSGRAGGRRVVLWPDTFTEHFRPAAGLATARVLGAAGFEVLVPGGDVCCGRPLYDYGFLGQARRLLRRSLDVLEPAIDAGLPMVVPEPSCASVFRDELVGLFPADDRARWLSRRTFTLGEFLADHAPSFALGRLDRPVLYHGHCHQKALAGTDSDETILRRLGATVSAPEAGCCGMAGAFGFEAGEHCDVSLRIGERRLLPAARAADPETLVVADGFSCFEQLRQGSGRQPLHLAEVLAQALPR